MLWMGTWEGVLSHARLKFWMEGAFEEEGPPPLLLPRYCYRVEALCGERVQEIE